MVASNSTNRAPGALGEYALGEFPLGSTFETLNLGAWSTPVARRYRREFHPRHQQFLAYGQTTVLTETVFYDRWAYQWRDPVRKKRGLGRHLQQAFTADTTPIPTGRNLAWFRGLDTPVRTKKGIRTALQRSFTIDEEFLIPPDEGIQGWFRSLIDPVRKKKGLHPALDPAFFFSPRVIPNIDITAVMAATEINTDIAIFAINVYDSSSPVTGGAASARVSIIEVPIQDDAALSISED